MVFNIFATLAQFGTASDPETVADLVKSSKSKRKIGVGEAEDFSKRSEDEDGEEAQQEFQYQCRGNLRYAEDFAGEVLSFPENWWVNMIEGKYLKCILGP